MQDPILEPMHCCIIATFDWYIINECPFKRLLPFFFTLEYTLLLFYIEYMALLTPLVLSTILRLKGI